MGENGTEWTSTVLVSIQTHITSLSLENTYMVSLIHIFLAVISASHAQKQASDKNGKITKTQWASGLRIVPIGILLGLSLAQFYEHVQSSINVSICIGAMSLTWFRHGTLSPKAYNTSTLCLSLVYYGSTILNISSFFLLGSVAGICVYASVLGHCVCVLSLTLSQRKSNDECIPEKEANIRQPRESIKSNNTESEDHAITADGAPLFSSITYSWVHPLLTKGYNKVSISPKDMFLLPNSVNVKTIQEMFSEKIRTTENETRSEGITQSSLLRALHKAYGFEFYIICGILEICLCSVNYCGPIALNLMLTYFENGNEPIQNGYFYAFVLCLAYVGKAFGDSRFDYHRLRVLLKVRISIMTTIYQKALRISTVSLSKFSTGEIVNFLGTDTNRIMNYCECFHAVWSCPVDLVVIMYLLYQLVGVASLGGFAVALVLLPLNKWIAYKQVQLEDTLMEQKDARTKMMNEVLGGIKIIKIYTWEDHFRDVLDELREEELQTLRQIKCVGAISSFLLSVTPVTITILTFSIYSALGHTLTAAKVFTSLSLFLMLLDSLNFLPWAFNAVMEAFVSYKRVSKFVTLKDMDLNSYYNDNTPVDKLISVKAGKFSWEEVKQHKKTSDISKGEKITSKSGTLKLRGISIDVTQGQFIGVTGKVGSGKSSLLKAILAEMYREDGEISVTNREHGFALAEQESWIQQASVRDNILFGQPFDAKKYGDVLDAASLTKDIEILPAGDKTEVGENGVTLSGGQKARLSLARALYQDKEVYLLDDPLAAVDAHVAQHMYDKCIMGLLKNKTRILCTHHTKFLGKADLVIVMDDGVISKMGLPSEILTNITFAGRKSSDNCKPRHGTVTTTEESDKDGKLGEDEVKETGEVKSHVYNAYVSALGKWLASFMLLSIICMQASKQLTDWWLTYWVSGSESMDKIQPNNAFCPADNMTTHISQSPPAIQTSMVYYLTVYGCLSGVYSLFSLAREVLFAYGGMSVAKTMHSNLLNTILRAPMSFFDITPIGRILSRFSSDIETIDDDLCDLFNMVVSQTFAVVGTMLIACYGMPWFVFLLVPVVAVFYKLQQYYRYTAREISRIWSATESSIFSHFSETVSGLVTIRAFRESERFQNRNMEFLDKHLRAVFSYTSVEGWLVFRVEMLGVVLVTGIAILAVVENYVHEIDPGMVGLAISYTILMTDIVSRLIDHCTETEKKMISVERVQQYVDDIASEKWTGTEPSPSWPATGEVSYTDVHMKYRESLPNVLKDLTFTTHHAEKVGIVGRTGSGKSSLFQTLFRTVEIGDGVITVDGENIQKLDLKILRQRLAMIPQDPFLFSGTVRENLDPTSRYSDEELWGVLDRCHLRLPVDRLGGLEGGVAEKGRHFSVGQRQLMCLARALLTKAKILCIDEATASVDLETDMLIQETIREEFKDSTVLTIAHRINTIMDSDRILVMDQGQVAELDSPENLLRNPESAFYKLVHG